MPSYEHLKNFDPEIYESIFNETKRQHDSIELIASENFVSEAVLEAMGSSLTNKYAEGTPHRRYYGGCEFVDRVEDLAVSRVKELFSVEQEHVNVQPHSGAQANTAVYFSVLKPGDRILGLDLSHGGHLTHGMKKNMSGFLYESHFYQVDLETEQLDYDAIEKTAMELKPKMIVAGASAYPRLIDFKKFREICDKVGAYLFVDMAHIAGLVAAGLHPSPFPHADFVTTTTHKTLRGPRGGIVFCKEEYAKIIDLAVFPGAQGGPLMHVIAAKAVAFKEALSDSFVTYQKNILANSKALAQGLISRGVNLVSGGTDNHLVLVNLIESGLTGRYMQDQLESVGITCNKNTVPNDPQKPMVTSGLRLGTPAVTTRGFGLEEMEVIADCVSLAITDIDKHRVDIARRVKVLCDKYPLYKDMM